jgi:tetratricopeptide (TPR) repeat protein
VRQYIRESVGYQKLDRLVLSAVVAGCVQSPRALVELVEHEARADSAATMLCGLATMLYEAQEFQAAERWAREALQARASKHGQDSVEVAAHLVQLGECMGRARTAHPAQHIRMFEAAIAIYERENGAGHISTASCLVSVGQVYIGLNDLHKGLEYARRALGIIETTHGPDTVESAGALALFGFAHKELGECSAALEHFRRRLNVLEAYHGKGAEVAEIAEALRDIGTVYSEQGDHDRALGWYTRAVPIAETTAGKLSFVAGGLYHSIGVAYDSQLRFAEAIPLFEQAVAAFSYAHGAENAHFAQRAQADLERVIDRVQQAVIPVPAGASTSHTQQQAGRSSRERVVRN